ncbi:retropepsin-like aspartic protease family protein [Sphingomonas alba]|uniref:TIGR02281 family clan AA aspartic protease n=1 Tax=Sphingomonas alba TaxID=2908208 RepID=A0ABT0RIX5_9SPHN|nr:TIGR02281 family clan AA aspartic protease [Sphingomonas alba]MCL6682555.1 TIGR02281 family clan AA aspartic protease [Sphingomonas alba]
MTNDVMLGGLYLLMAAMLVLGGLMSRREPLAKLAVMGLAWVAIFAGGFVLFTFRDNLGWVAQRLRAEATGTPVEVGQTLRIPMAIDGHFWVTARINGHDVKFLVDSGATMTTIGMKTARDANVSVDSGRDQLVRTGNGMVRVASGSAETVEIGPIVRQGMQLHVTQDDDLNVLGMNFLSSLQRWGVEGRWLVLQP